MTDKEFDWFCKVLKWSTNLSLTLIVLIILLIPFAFFMADEKPWSGLLGFVIFIFCFLMISKDKNKFIKGDKADLGIYGSGSIEYPLWQNVVFWFFYLLMEVAVAGGTIGIFVKAIWSS
jgi:hypothetical protein